MVNYGLETRSSERETSAVVVVGLKHVVFRYSFRILLNSVDLSSHHVSMEGVLLGPMTSNRISAQPVRLQYRLCFTGLIIGHERYQQRRLFRVKHRASRVGDLIIFRIGTSKHIPCTPVPWNASIFLTIIDDLVCRSLQSSGVFYFEFRYLCGQCEGPTFERVFFTKYCGVRGVVP